MDLAKRATLLALAERMDVLATRRKNHMEISVSLGGSLLNDLETNAEEVAEALRLLCAHGLMPPQARAG